MLILTQKAELDPSGEKFEEGVDIPISWPINRRRAEDQEGNFMAVGKSQFLAHSFAIAIG
jgi:hypothetical protein